METFSALLAICAGNSPVHVEFLTTRSFDVIFDLRLSKRLCKQWWGWLFESRPLCRHRNVLIPLWRKEPQNHQLMVYLPCIGVCVGCFPNNKDENQKLKYFTKYNGNIKDRMISNLEEMKTGPNKSGLIIYSSYISSMLFSTCVPGQLAADKLRCWCVRTKLLCMISVGNWPAKDREFTCHRIQMTEIYSQQLNMIRAMNVIWSVQRWQVSVMLGNM